MIYADAIAEFDRVDQAYFASMELHWRNIKTDELKLAGLIRSGATDIKSTLLADLADRYATADQVDRPIPSEIVKTLAMPENRDGFDTPSSIVAALVCRLISACGDEKVFPKEFATLEAGARALDDNLQLTAKRISDCNGSSRC